MNSTSRCEHDFVVVDYLVSGPRTVAGVVRKQVSLLGMSLLDSAGEATFVAGNLQQHLMSLGNRRRVYFDAAFGRAVERQFGLPSTGDFDDLKIMDRLLNVDGSPELNRLSYPSSSEESLRRIRQIGLAFGPGNYSGRIAAEHLTYVYQSVELPIVDVVIDMTRNGIPANQELLRGIEAGQSVQLDIARCQLVELARRDLNPDSAADVAAFLFNEAGLPVLVRARDGSPSTSDQVLDQLEQFHPAVRPLRYYRTAKSARDAARQLLAHFNPETSCIHAELDQLGAATGRFSCSNPALQSLPPPLLSVFQAPTGYVFLEADFSQIELRVLAQLSQDTGFVQAFRGPLTDIHRRTAAAALGIAEDQVTAEQRSIIGKGINFGIVYGVTPRGLVNNLGLDYMVAQSLVDAFSAQHPGVVTWIEAVHQEASDTGCVTTAYGRRRRLSEARRTDSASDGRSMRQAVNTVIQGTAADINKLALDRLFRTLPQTCRLLLTNHDSFLILVPTVERQEVINLIRRTLEAPPPGFTVPIQIDVRQGGTWAACKFSV